jgi:hypothetical protein
VGKVNWTIVAISAGVTLGAGVAVLSTDSPATTNGGLVVPPTLATLGEQPARIPVRPVIREYPDDPVAPQVVVVPVAPAGYAQSLIPPPVAAPLKPVLVSVPAVVRPVRAVTRTVAHTVRNVASPALSITRQVTSSIPVLSGFDWFTSPSVVSSGTGRHYANSVLSTFSSTRSGCGRHRR